MSLNEASCNKWSYSQTSYKFINRALYFLKKLAKILKQHFGKQFNFCRFLNFFNWQLFITVSFYMLKRMKKGIHLKEYNSFDAQKYKTKTFTPAKWVWNHTCEVRQFSVDLPASLETVNCLHSLGNFCFSFSRLKFIKHNIKSE